MVKTVEHLESEIPMTASEGAVILLGISAFIGIGYLFAWGQHAIRELKADYKSASHVNRNTPGGQQHNQRPSRNGQGPGQRQQRPR